MPRKKKTAESNRFDKIVKENLEKVLPRLAAIAGIHYDRMENLPMTKLQATIEREPDFACMIYNQEYPKGAVMQFEMETSVKALPAYDGRMFFYYGLFFQKLRREVLQTLFYLGDEEPKFRNRILHKHVNFNYLTFWVRKIPHEQFLHSKQPEDVVFSILTDFQGKPAEEIIEKIIHCLQRLLGDTLALQKFIAQLRMLSQLRNLQPQTNQKIKDMFPLKGISIKKDPLYQEGREEGREEGMVKGKEEKTYLFVKTLLEEDFEVSYIARLADVSIQFVQQVKAEMALEKSIRDLLKKGVKDAAEIARQLQASPAQVKKILTALKRR